MTNQASNTRAIQPDTFYNAKTSGLTTNSSSPLRGMDTTLGHFEQRRLLEESRWKDRSFHVGEPHHHPIGRGTHRFECHTPQERQFRDTWSEFELYNERNIAGVLEHRYSSRSIFPDPRQHIRSRVILDAVRMPLPEFPSTHAFVSYIHDAALAHLDAFKLAGVEHRDISIGNIVFAQNKDGSATGIIMDWEDTNRAYERTGTLQFKAARLCSPSPPPRTIGDDVESFVLLLLWMAARYAPNNMTPSERGAFLAKFDLADGSSKMYMILAGTTTVVNLKLLSSGLGEVLEDILEVYCSRYMELTSREKKKPEVVEELERRQALLDGQDWLIGILRMALQDESWANDTDGSRKEQPVERPSRVRTIGVDLF